MGVPAGIEMWPTRCDGTAADTDPGDDVPLIGLRLSEALDRIVGVHRDAAWRESDSVIVFRPVREWANREHFLHRTLPSFGVAGLDYRGALAALTTALGHTQTSFAEVPGRTEQAQRPLSVSAASRSVIEALDAIVRAHGALEWVVRYCNATVGPETAWIGLLTHDAAFSCRRWSGATRTGGACAPSVNSGSRLRAAGSSI